MGNSADTKVKDEVVVFAWLKSDFSWYTPEKDVDLRQFDVVELLSLNYYGDLFYGYMEGNKEYGRLFKGRWNKGIY